MGLVLCLDILVSQLPLQFCNRPRISRFHGRQHSHSHPLKFAAILGLHNAGFNHTVAHAPLITTVALALLSSTAALAPPERHERGATREVASPSIVSIKFCTGYDAPSTDYAKMLRRAPASTRSQTWCSSRATPPHHEHIKGSRPSQLRAAAKREEHLLLLANQEGRCPPPSPSRDCAGAGLSDKIDIRVDTVCFRLMKMQSSRRSK